MNKRLARLAVAGVGMVAVLGSAPAFALGSTTAGSNAYTSQSRVPDDTAKVRDTSADSRSAYGQYYRYSEPGVIKNLWNKSGSGTTVSSTGSKAIYQIRACRQEQVADNTCGPWDAH